MKVVLTSLSAETDRESGVLTGRFELIFAGLASIGEVEELKGYNSFEVIPLTQERCKQ